MKQLTISDFLLDTQKKNKRPQYSCKNKVEDIISGETKKQRLVIKNGLYESYEIEIDEDQKIKTIKFIFSNGKKNIRFKIQVQSYQIQRIQEAYGGEYIIIKNLSLGKISEKAKVGYKEAKNKINYFSYLGLEYNSIQNFIKDILLNYHQNK